MRSRPATSVTVNEAVLRASVTNVTAVEGQTFNGVVATFNDDNPFPTPTDFTATIDWGDGTTSPGTIKRGNDPGNSFIVTGSHVYDDEITGEPPFILVVTISELNDGASATVQGTATVTDARLIPTPDQPPIAAVEGTVFSGVVATFIDENVNCAARRLQRSIRADDLLGDGQTSIGTVVKDVIPGQFDVVGSHIYAKDTTLPIPVIVTINDEGGMKATVNNTAMVSDPPLTPIALGPITITVGTPLPAGTVISEFADPNPLAAAGDFRAGIDWGDGTTLTAGTVQQAGLVFNVIATHTYTTVGTFKTTVTIVDPSRKVELVDDPEIIVVDAALTPTGATVFATEQVPFTANVATFIDADPFPDVSKFSAKIDWGDDQTSAGIITSHGTSPSGMTFVVSGSHTYNDNGVMNHQITVTIVDSEGSQTVALGQAILALRPAPTDPQGATFTATEGILSPLGTLATFTDPDPNVQPGDFTVSINWGDGSSIDASSGVVTVSGTGTGRTFSVNAQHLYAEEGTYSVSVTIADQAGHVTIANSKAVVADAALTSLPAEGDLGDRTPVAERGRGRVLQRRQPLSRVDGFQGDDRLGRRLASVRRRDQPAGRNRHGVPRLGRPHVRRGSRRSLRDHGHRVRLQGRGPGDRDRAVGNRPGGLSRTRRLEQPTGIGIQATEGQACDECPRGDLHRPRINWPQSTITTR